MKTINEEKSSTAGLLRRRWVIVVTVIATLFLAVIVVTPYIMELALEDWLRDNGADQVEIDDIDFNPVTGITVIELLNVKVGEHDTLVIPRLTLDLDWSPLFSRQVYIKAVALDGVEIDVSVDENGAMNIGGIELDTGESDEETDEPWDYGIVELIITNSVLDFRNPVLRVKTGIDDLKLTELTTWASAPAPVTFTGTFNGASIHLDGQLPPLSAGYGYSGRVKVDDLSLAIFEQLAAPAVTGLAGRVMLDTDFSVTYTEDKPLVMKQDGQIQVSELQLKQGEDSIGYAQLQWQGVVDVSLADVLEMASNGVLNGNDLVIDMPGEGARLKQGSLAWEGKAGYSDAEDGAVQAGGQLRFERTELDPADGQIHLANFDVLEVHSLAVQGLDAISIDSINVNGATFAESVGKGDGTKASASELPPLQIASMEINSLKVTDGNRIAIKTIDVQDAQYVARRNKDGQWRMVTILETLPFAGEEAEPEPGAKPGSLQLETMKIHGNSTLTVQDYDVSPPFRMRFNIEEIVHNDFDSGNPDQVNRILWKGNISKHNRILIKGTVVPLATPVSLKLDVTVEGLELPPMSPYSIDSIGYRMDSGQLDSDSSLRIDKGQLDGTNKLTMRGLQMTPVKGEQLDKMENQLAVPLNKGLDMLRDDHDVIRVDLPITGDLDNPDFDASDAINQAVAKAAREAAITSLTLLLQPYGSLITIARYAADKAAEVKLDPVVFAPASATVDEARHDYLDKVAGIIKKRPNINIRLCGVATEADREALIQQTPAARADKQDKADKAEPPAVEIPDEQLQTLADQRDEAVKDYLVSQHGIKPGRLVACQPAIDSEADAEPRVDLLI
ncbi:MAG: DUF748 domain-containing protein [Pseudomonadota bacterium]